jgi:hypothetical protein
VETRALEDQAARTLQAAVDRVLSSSCFQRSRRLYELLGYLTEQTLKGDADALKESVIGHRLFGRPPDYSAAEDNIVRSNIRQLRMKLEEFYLTEGIEDTSRVTIPKGSYGIVLQRVTAPADRSPGRPQNSAPPKPARTNRRTIAIASLATCAVVFGVVLSYTGHKNSRPSSLLGLLTPELGRRLLVVVPDANVQLYQRLTGHPVTLQDYLERRFKQPDEMKRVAPDLAKYAGALFQSPATQGFVLTLIPDFARAVGAEFLSVRTPDMLTVKDFEGDNALLISGPFGDPWVQLFDNQLNFQIETGGDNRSAHIVNREPQAGEKREYWNFVDPSQTTICYARLAYLPGLTLRSRVLLAGGPHTASTEAASLFLTRSESAKQLCDLFHVKTPSQLPWFELLIEARALGNSPWTMRILASRRVSTPSR